MKMSVRPIEKEDFDRGYIELLNVLSSPSDGLKREWFEGVVESLGPWHQIWVLESIERKMVATITLLVERKMIRGGSHVLHVEDVIVHPDYQKQGIGRQLMKKARDVADEHNCYKIILDCNEANAPFYEFCQFQRHQVQMAWYR